MLKLIFIELGATEIATFEMDLRYNQILYHTAEMELVNTEKWKIRSNIYAFCQLQLSHYLHCCILLSKQLEHVLFSQIPESLISI